MPVAVITEFPIGARSTENYDFVAEKLNAQEIDGLLVHSAGFDDGNDVWRQVDIWETREQAERFMKQMTEGFDPTELPRPDTAAQEPTRQGMYELHGFVKT